MELLNYLFITFYYQRIISQVKLGFQYFKVNYFNITFSNISSREFLDKWDEQGKQPYKYNGKELDQELGLNTYDYSARYFDPALPRFTTVDPHAENYYSWSPYAYCANNPVKFIDPTGMDYRYNWETGEYEYIDSDGNKSVVSADEALQKSGVTKNQKKL